MSVGKVFHGNGATFDHGDATFSWSEPPFKNFTFEDTYSLNKSWQATDIDRDFIADIENTNFAVHWLERFSKDSRYEHMYSKMN